MRDRQKIFFMSMIVILALIALIEGAVLLNNSSFSPGLKNSFGNALSFLIPLKGSLPKPDNVFPEQKMKEDMALQETAEDLDNMQNQINRLFNEMAGDMRLARQNFARQDMFNRSPFQPRDGMERLQSEIAHIFRKAHESRHRGALELIERDWGNVDKISSMNIDEAGTNYVVTVSMPGYERSDIEISLNGRILTVEASTESRRTAQDSRAYRTGSFKTQIMMPDDIKGEAAKASFEKELLKITIPRKEAGNSLARKVTIM
jgi:HSP20 family protein